MMYISLPHTLQYHFFMEKDLKRKFSKIFSEQKTPKGGIFKGKEARKMEDLSLQTTAPETRTNLCSNFKYWFKIKREIEP